VQYESAGRRRDGAISREGSVALRRALIDLGVGLWLTDPPSKTYAAALRARGKPGGIIACALAHRATRIAHALVRDQAEYNPTRWTQPTDPQHRPAAQTRSTDPAAPTRQHRPGPSQHRPTWQPEPEGPDQTP
jgi:transposase